MSGGSGGRWVGESFLSNRSIKWWVDAIAKLWKEPRCPVPDEWRVIWYIYIYPMEYHSVIKKNESLPFATMWMEPAGIKLSKISQSEKDKYHMISLIWNLRNKTEDHRGREGKNKTR